MNTRRWQKGVSRGEVLSLEKGTIIKKWHGRIPVCVVYPNTYYIGMSNLATHMLYKTLNSIPEVVCERCFIEDSGECLSVESGRPLASFECIFFTVCYEMDYVNIVRILQLSGVTVSTRKRREDEPIVLAGGIAIMANPEPICSFIDIFLLGDIETTVQPLMKRYMEVREKKRDQILDELSSFDWAYAPRDLNIAYREDGVPEGFVPRDFRVTIDKYKGKHLGTSSIITAKTEFSDMYLIEGTRGCPSRCPFCLLGHAYGFLYDKMKDIATEATQIGLVGGGMSFHPRLVEVARELKEAGKGVHLPSLRMDEVPFSLIELIQDDVKTLTFGIEAGTERLRRFIGKPLTDEEVYEKTDAILGLKPFNLKLYFMIGLYGEQKDDIEAILSLVKHIKHIMVKKGAKKGRVGTITVHASPFVPKPSTPFQWLPMEEMTILKDKISLLKKGFAKVDNTYFTHDSVKYSFIQGVFSRGDRKTKDTISRLASGDSFSRIVKESPFNLNFYALRQRPKDEIFPWDFIKGKTSKGRLYALLDERLNAPGR